MATPDLIPINEQYYSKEIIIDTNNISFWFQGKINPNWNRDYIDFSYAHKESRMSKSRSFKTTAQYQHSQPQWLTEIITALGTDITAWSINCYHPNTVIRNVGKLSKVVGNLKVMIFLEPWSTGNYLEINKQAFTDWSAGTLLAFPESSDVIDINLGNDPRYTVELLGCL